MKFKAVITWEPSRSTGKVTETIQFTLSNLVSPNPIFSIRELVIPWLREGNIPQNTNPGQ